MATGYGGFPSFFRAPQPRGRSRRPRPTIPTGPDPPAARWPSADPVPGPSRTIAARMAPGARRNRGTGDGERRAMLGLGFGSPRAPFRTWEPFPHAMPRVWGPLQSSVLGPLPSVFRLLSSFCPSFPALRFSFPGSDWAARPPWWPARACVGRDGVPWAWRRGGDVVGAMERPRVKLAGSVAEAAASVFPTSHFTLSWDLPRSKFRTLISASRTSRCGPSRNSRRMPRSTRAWIWSSLVWSVWAASWSVQNIRLIVRLPVLIFVAGQRLAPRPSCCRSGLALFLLRRFGPATVEHRAATSDPAVSHKDRQKSAGTTSSIRTINGINDRHVAARDDNLVPISTAAEERASNATGRVGGGPPGTPIWVPKRDSSRLGSLSRLALFSMPLRRVAFPGDPNPNLWFM